MFLACSTAALDSRIACSGSGWSSSLSGWGYQPGGCLEIVSHYITMIIDKMLYLDIPAPRKTRSVSGLYFLSATRIRKFLRKKFVFSLRMTSHCTEGYLDKKSAQGSTMWGGGMSGWWCVNNKPYSGWILSRLTMMLVCVGLCLTRVYQEVEPGSGGAGGVSSPLSSWLCDDGAENQPGC